MAIEKMWTTKAGEEIPYKELKDDHLQNIIRMLESKKRTQSRHYKWLKRELTNRLVALGPAGKILYGKK